MRAVYTRERITKTARRRLARMERCQHSIRARKAAKRTRGVEARKRAKRRTRAARARCAKGWKVGASVYGGPSDSSGTIGYRGDSLPGTSSYAELMMGSGLGGLPRNQKLYIRYAGKTVVAYKRDIGAGGNRVSGYPRAIDLWHEVANKLGISGVAVVTVSKKRLC